MMSIAKRNSNTEEKWIAQVGIERALTGSECITAKKKNKWSELEIRQIEYTYKLS